MTSTCTLCRKYTPILPVQPTDHINTSLDHAENLLVVKPLAVMAIKYTRMQDFDKQSKTTFALAEMHGQLKGSENISQQNDISKDGVNLFLS